MKVVYNGKRPKGFTSTQILIIPIAVATAIAALLLIWNISTKDERIAAQRDREQQASSYSQSEDGPPQSSSPAEAE